MLAHRRRRWASIKPSLGECLNVLQEMESAGLQKKMQTALRLIHPLNVDGS